MKLAIEEFKALEEIVGPEYISADPVITESYNQVWGNKLVFGEKFTQPPAAVLLPAGTAQIQAILRACNKYDIKFKAFASGFEFVATVLEKDRSIILDLRRLDRILEIDARNQRAVVEPYVSVYKLQMEAAKYGLYTGRPGVGYSASVVALTCCHQEMLNSQVYTSGFGRNVLGAEWVLPTGEVLELGASGKGWFSADGPGFSLRGILRGRSGANGGHGVLTKASVKLYPWYGPKKWEMLQEAGGPPSSAQLEKVPERYRAYIVTYPSVDQMIEAATQIARAEIACVLIPGHSETGFPGEGNDEQWEMMQKARPEDIEKAVNSATVILNSHSDREMEYRENCLKKINELFSGQILPERNTPKEQARLFMYQMWSTGVPGVRATGDFMVSIQGADGSPAMMRNILPVEIEAINAFKKSGALAQASSGLMYRPQENFSVGCSGGIGINFDPWDPVSLDSAQQYMRKVYDPDGSFRRYGYTGRGAMIQVESLDHIHQRWGPVYDNCDLWLRKVKAALDPNNVSDSSCYIPPEYAEEDSKATT